MVGVIGIRCSVETGAFRRHASQEHLKKALGHQTDFIAQSDPNGQSPNVLLGTFIFGTKTSRSVSSLKTFAVTNHLSSSSFKAIGALNNVELGWFNWESKKYQIAAKLEEQVELLSLIGDIALKDNEPHANAHIIVGCRDGTAHGGHLLSATVRPTCEIVLTESQRYLRKEIDPEPGIALIRI